MPMTWHLDPSGLLHVIGTGIVTDEEYLEAHKEYTAATAGQVGPRRSLADWSGVTGVQLTSAAIHTTAGVATEQMQGREDVHRIALVAVAPVVYGMCRMWQTLISESGVECDVFRTREEALAWLEH